MCYPCRAPLLKSLHLTKSCNVTSKGLAEAIKKFPLLEEFELCECERYDTWVFEILAAACPRLKHFKHVNDRGYSWYNWERDLYPVDNREALAIAGMHELRSLKLYHSGLDNQGLTAILGGCPHLESLDIRYCSITMDSSMRAKCARVKTKKVFPYAPTDDWVRPLSGVRDDFVDDSSKYFEPGSPVSRCHSPRDSYWWCRSNGEEPDCRFFNVEPCDSDDSDHSLLFRDAEEAEFEYWRI